MKGLAELLKLIQKLYGKKAISKTIGTRTNVITLPDKDTKRFITNELNVDAASDDAVKKAFEDVEKLIPDIPKMNDQEILTLTGNLRRLDNRMNPPSAEVIEFGTKKPVSPAGIKQLEAERGLPEDVDPNSPLGRIMQKVNKVKIEGGNLADEFGVTDFLTQGLKGLDDVNPARPGGPLDPKVGIVRTAAREILERDLKKGKIEIPDPRERDAIVKGYQGGVDPIDVLRKRYGEGILEELDDIADDLNKATDYNQITKMLDEKGLLDKRPKATYEYDEGVMSDEELAKLLKESETPDEFATGGRVGFAYGSLPKGIQKLYRAINKKFGKGTIKTADELENPKRPLTDEEIQMYEEELGDSETWMSSGTLEEAENALKRREEYEAAMYRDYKAGKLDDTITVNVDEDVMNVPEPFKGKYKDEFLAHDQMFGKTSGDPKVDAEEIASQVAEMKGLDYDDLGYTEKMNLYDKAYNYLTLRDRVMGAMKESVGRTKQAEGGRIEMAKGGVAYLMGL